MVQYVCNCEVSEIMTKAGVNSSVSSLSEFKQVDLNQDKPPPEQFIYNLKYAMDAYADDLADKKVLTKFIHKLEKKYGKGV